VTLNIKIYKNQFIEFRIILRNLIVTFLKNVTFPRNALNVFRNTFRSKQTA